MSAPPASRASMAAAELAAAELAEEKAAGAGAGSSRLDTAASAEAFLLHRLTKPGCKEALTMQLRPRLQETHESLFDSLTNTVELEHNSSLLLVGPRGCGKSLVTERALAALQALWNTDPRDPVVGVIRLSGWTHCEERAAFREAARQLCEVFRHQFSRSATVGEKIEFLRGMLGALSSCDKCAVFVLDDFDLFASKSRKQTVLYNLLDALQTSGMRGKWVPPEAAAVAARLAEQHSSWQCGACSLVNAPSARTCEACGHLGPGPGDAENQWMQQQQRQPSQQQQQRSSMGG